ncbi:hypothetical protein TNCT_85741 [Trichonephila clavata]|uniref:Uncharacterized protein n=1 Tax=Trichonephila clavata TaxID=2740835 RepID=A0A8X6L7X3_TRICU|nr:hypothetical protein TNCT_85741 [Trichonephila clavata]
MSDRRTLPIKNEPLNFSRPFDYHRCLFGLQYLSPHLPGNPRMKGQMGINDSSLPFCSHFADYLLISLDTPGYRPGWIFAQSLILPKP